MGEKACLTLRHAILHSPEPSPLLTLSLCDDPIDLVSLAPFFPRLSQLASLTLRRITPHSSVIFGGSVGFRAVFAAVGPEVLVTLDVSQNDFPPADSEAFYGWLSRAIGLQRLVLTSCRGLDIDQLVTALLSNQELHQTLYHLDLSFIDLSGYARQIVTLLCTLHSLRIVVLDGTNYRVRWKAENGRLIDYVIDAQSGAIRSAQGE